METLNRRPPNHRGRNDEQSRHEKRFVVSALRGRGISGATHTHIYIYQGISTGNHDPYTGWSSPVGRSTVGWHSLFDRGGGGSGSGHGHGHDTCDGGDGVRGGCGCDRDEDGDGGGIDCGGGS